MTGSVSNHVPVRSRAQLFERLVYDYLPALGLMSYLVILMVPWWWLSDWYDFVDAIDAGAAFPYQVAGLGAFSLSILPLAVRTLGQNEFVTVSTARGMFVGMFFGFCLAFLVLAEAPGWRPVIYVVLTWALFVFAAAFWSANYTVVRHGLGCAGLIVLAFLIVLLLKHGLVSPGTARRSVGGIQPNSYGRAALAGLVLTFFLPRWMTYPAVAAAVILMVLVSSRSALLAAAIFLLMYAILTARSTRTLSLQLRFVTIGLALVVGTLAFELYLLHDRGTSLLTLFSEKVLLLNDPIRGLGSGFTGRTGAWLEGLRRVTERPFFGYGFRMTVTYAHTGYLNLMLDVGIPLAVWFVVFIIVEIGARAAAVGQLMTERADTAEHGESSLLHRIVGAYLTSMLAVWLFEPNYLNLGTPNIILFVVLLAAPSAPRGIAMCRPSTNILRTKRSRTSSP